MKTSAACLPFAAFAERFTSSLKVQVETEVPSAFAFAWIASRGYRKISTGHRPSLDIWADRCEVRETRGARNMLEK